jgi:trimethylamine--corrinoid protein Co-methyltransferase
VSFDAGHVRALCSTAPEVFTQHARNPKRSVEIGGKSTVFSPAYGSPFVSDLEGGRRYGSLKDFESFIKLAYVSPWLHHSGGTVCEPVEIPVNKRHLDMVYAHMRWSDKAFMGSVTHPDRARDSIEMCRILFGADFVDRNCVILGNINVNSPLVYDGIMSGALRAYAEANQCTVVVPFILGGAMGPVTTAGALAQAYAEAMVGIALTQLVRKGSPAIFGNFLSSMSLRSGAPTFGMPEPSLAYFAFGQLARRARLPFRLGGGLTASKAVDVQASQEASDTMMATMLSGANFVLHAAGWLEGGLVMSYEKLVLDADHCGMMHRLAQGIALDENGFAFGAFQEVGPGSHFFGSKHTFANYETAFHEPELSDNASFEQWRDMGGEDSTQRANRRWKEMLAAYEPPPIDPGVDEALREFVAKRKTSMPDAWH